MAARNAATDADQMEEITVPATSHLVFDQAPVSSPYRALKKTELSGFSVHIYPCNLKVMLYFSCQECSSTPPCYMCVCRGVGGADNHPRRSRQHQLQQASRSTWLCLSPILLGTSCGLSAASIKSSDAAAINMHQ